MKPFSAGYYIKNNKGRSAIVIFMMFLTVCMLLAGNYLGSLWWYYEEAEKLDQQIVTVGAITTDTDYADWKSFTEDLKSDTQLIAFGRTGRANGSMLDANTTIGLEVGTGSYVFNSAEDLQRAFNLLKIDFDCSGLSDMDMVMSENFAKNISFKIGDVTPDRQFTLRGTFPGDSYVSFRIYTEPEENYYRYNLMSETLRGDALREHVRELIGDRKINIERQMVHQAYKEMEPVKAIFYAGLIILSVILAVTLNSVVTGQYVKREYEFGVYRALGIPKGRIRRKVAAELALMDVIALAAGIAVILLFSFLMNELYYIPRGKFLPYRTKMGVEGLALSNLVVLLPMIYMKGRRMSRMDVTEF